MTRTDPLSRYSANMPDFTHLDQPNIMADSSTGTIEPSESNHFPYSSLSKDDIRLLTCSSGSNGALKLSLSHYKYDSQLEYDALSYAWNTDGPKCTIPCNESDLSLSVELRETLKELATTQNLRPLWVDYICINQRDGLEKSWQLKKMGEYYSRAKQVWIWLGQPSSAESVAMGAMSSLAMRLPTLDLVQPVTDQWLERNGLPPQRDELWTAIDKLLTRKWFDRLWTMQEFALATNTTFVCGRDSVPGPDFVTVARNLLRLGLTALARKSRIPRVGYKDGYHFVTISDRFREEKQRRSYMTLELALQLGRFKESRGSNGHDRVYALLGLVDPEVTAQIRGTYDMPHWEMYVEVGKLSLRTSKHLEIMAQCQSLRRPPEIPSWCPDWAAENETAPFFYDYYFAGLLDEESSRPHVDLLPGTSHISVRGACITKVGNVSKPLGEWDAEWKNWERGNSSYDISAVVFMHTLRWMNECLELSTEALGLPQSVLLEAFIRTIVGDVINGQTGNSYEQLREMWTSGRQFLTSFGRSSDHASPDTQQQALAHTFLDSMYHACRFRSFFVTEDARLALGPAETRLGDRVVIFQSARMPFVLRSTGDDGPYKVIGPAYVRGLMMGQVLRPDMLRDQFKDAWEMFELE